MKHGALMALHEEPLQVMARIVERMYTCVSGSPDQILVIEIMASTSRTEIKKFNGTGYELWKLKMEDLLEERDQWVAVKNENKPTGISDEDWVQIDKKARGTIRLCLSDFVLLNVSNVATEYKLWKRIGEIY
eukprot:Gb_09999 [translate_table: standard]